jgi:hypothetical protein
VTTKSAGEVAGPLITLLVMAATAWGVWHGVDRHGRTWFLVLGLPPVAWYYAAESAWHSDGRAEFCGKTAQCQDTLAELGVEPLDYDSCMRKTEIALTGESSRRLRAFETLAKKVEKMTCQELAEWSRESQSREAKK